MRSTLVALLLFGHLPAHGQEPTPETTPTPRPIVEQPLVPALPPPPVPSLAGDPLLEPPGDPAPGWFSAVDVGILVPHIKNSLSANVGVGGTTSTVTVPVTELDWNMTTRVEFGYRFPEGAGEVVGSYRNLNARGRVGLPDFDALGGGVLETRLDANVGDLDYGIRDHSLGPLWDVKWRVGGRLAGVYFDSREQGAFLGQRVSNNFVGFGPHGVLDLWRRLGDGHGLSLFARVEGAVLIGGIGQSYEETRSVGRFPFLGGALRDTGVQSVPVLNFQVGLGWTPPGNDRLRMAAGYQYEHWWYLGYLSDARADLGAQGVFVRMEFGY